MTLGIKAKRRLSHGALHAVLIFFALLICVPFLWMISTSLKSSLEILTSAGRSFWDIWIPRDFSPGNYLEAVQYDGYLLLRGFKNTLVVVVPTLVIGIFSSSISAYAFAKMKFPGRDKIFFALICMMMIPGVITMVPSFILYNYLGWIDTYAPLMVPGMFGSITGVFFLRQFFMGIPEEVLESARIDGAGEFRIYAQIMVPMSKTAIATQMVMGFMGGYNDFVGPLIYLNTPEKFTLQLSLASMTGFYTTPWAMLMSACVIALIPSLIIYFFAQNYFVQGIASQGLKV